MQCPQLKTAHATQETFKHRLSQRAANESEVIVSSSSEQKNLKDVCSCLSCLNYSISCTLQYKVQDGHLGDNLIRQLLYLMQECMAAQTSVYGGTLTNKQVKM